MDRMDKQHELMSSVFTTCDMLKAARLSAVERVLDESPISIVSRIGETDPPERKCSEFRGGVTAIVDGDPDRAYIWINSSGRSRSVSFTTMATLQHEGVRIPLCGYDQGYSDVMFTLQADEFTDPVLDQFRGLFVELAAVTGAFYGRSGPSSMYVQRNEFMEKSGPLLGARLFPDFNRELPDVYWLNYFGPGYVEHWGKDNVDALSAEYELHWSANTGFCVVTTPRPVTPDPDINGITDYPFKKHFYDVLGLDTFIYENQERGYPGQYVPTL